MNKERLAIIGSGIAGMGAAYFLRDQFDITFFDKNDYAGGHTNTVTVDEDGRDVHVDSAFMVYNEHTYPNLTKLFAELAIDTIDTDMSFSVHHQETGYEYAGASLPRLFAQKRNMFSPSHWKMLLDIKRFAEVSEQVIDDPSCAALTVGQFIDQYQFSEEFLENFLLPMSSAVWSTPADTMRMFPAMTLIKFFKNHGFVGLDTQYQWKTVKGGSRQYRDKLLKKVGADIKLDTKIIRVHRRMGDNIKIVDEAYNAYEFDRVIIAAHADQALGMLDLPSELEKELLSKFPYNNNYAILHTDESLMPQRKAAWAAWNYRVEKSQASTIYWMNLLQQVSEYKNYFVSINDPGNICDEHILWERQYHHPIYTIEGMQAQPRLHELNTQGTQVYFCGSYFNYGFHEDALTAGIDVARTILGREVWQ